MTPLTTIIAVVAAFAAGPEADIEQERLLQHIRDLPPNRTAWAAPEDQHALLETERIIERKLRELGYDPIEQPLEWTNGGVARVKTDDGWTTVPDPEPNTWRNFYVEIPGRETPEEVIIVGAHFDTHPNTPGADDNASGTAAALEIARVLKDRPMRRTVRIVFFNLEEIGLVGAREHAQWTKERIDAGIESIIGMMSLEMIGYFTDEPDSQRSPIPRIEGFFEPPTVGDFIAVVATYNSRVFSREFVQHMRDAAPELKIEYVDFLPGQGQGAPDVRRSDHAPFWDIGVPAVLITDTSEFRTPHYHKPTDTIDTLDHERMTMVVQSVAGAVWRMAGPIDEDAPAGP